MSDRNSPCVKTWTEEPSPCPFGLRQGEEGGPFAEGDGMYFVDVDLTDGRIEDILYDPGLAANE